MATAVSAIFPIFWCIILVMLFSNVHSMNLMKIVKNVWNKMLDIIQFHNILGNAKILNISLTAK